MSSTRILKYLSLILSLLLLNSTAFAFDDVEEGDKHYVAISYLEELGIVDGYDDNTFRAHQNINRAEALKMMTNASLAISEEDLNNLTTNTRPFTDTPLSQWYTKYLIIAKQQGIIDGYADGSFQPDKTINLAESLKIYLESYSVITYPNIEDYIFADTPEDSWFAKYTAYAGSEGLINIHSENNIYPNQEMTRGYTAEIIYRKLMSEQGYEFGKATFYGAAVQGHFTASGEVFDMYKMTAAHKTLPFGTMVEVTNLANGESVVVKINDRGPYGYGRVIDLSSSAFEEIAWLGTGVIYVQYEILSTP